MSLRKTLRLLHEARLKEIRDRNAQEDYVRSEVKTGSTACTVVLLLTNVLEISINPFRIKNIVSRCIRNMEYFD